MTRSHRARRERPALDAPIKGVLDDSLSEADIQRMWRDVQSKNPAHMQSVRARWVAIGAMCAMALCALLALWLLPAKAPRAAGPLAIVGANATRSGLGPAQVFGGERPERLSLDDGSRIDLDHAARLEVLENSSRTFATHLRGGRCEFDVTPGGPRRWSIECGVVTVEVIGTHFAIDRSEQGVRVDVSRGVVLVRGERVADRVRRLTAGQSLYVSSAPVRAQPAAAPAPAAAIAATAVPASGTPAAASARRQAHEPELSATTADLWLRRADDARRDGQSERAEALLEAVVQRVPGSPHAAIAALTLARLLMADDPARAAAALASVSAARAPVGLREDIMARLVEAHARTGQLDLAREAAAHYTRAFPHGRRLDEVRHWANANTP